MMQVVYVSTLDWNQAWQRHQAFATEFAKNGWKVFYINNTGFARLQFSDFKRVIARLKSQNNVKVNGIPRDTIELLTPLVVPPGLPFQSFANERFFFPRLASELLHRGLRRPFALYSYLPGKLTLDLIDRLKPDKFIYDFVSNFFVHPRRPKDFLVTHRKLLKRTDLLLTDSERLAEQLLPDFQPVHLIHHGVSSNFFPEFPPSVVRFPRSLCYFGTIDQRILDFSLIHTLVEGGYEVRLIGPVKGDLPEVHPKVRMTPQLTVEQLALEIQKSDVILLPYLKTSFNEGVMPAKIFQCLATGLPIVSVGLPSLAKLQAEGLVCGAVDSREVLEVLARLPQTESRAKIEARIELARKNSEEGNAAKLRELIEGLNRI